MKCNYTINMGEDNARFSSAVKHIPEENDVIEFDGMRLVVMYVSSQFNYDRMEMDITISCVRG